MHNSTAQRPVTVSVLSTPEPSWFKSSSLTAGSWASWLMMAHQYGRVVDHSAGFEVDAEAGDFYILLAGTMVVSSLPLDPALKPLFIDTLRRGDLIVPSRHSELKFSYVVRGSTSLLKVPKDKFRALMNDMKNSEVVMMAAEINLLTKHATAASTVQMKDQDKIWRVVVNLASHPEVDHRQGGVEVMASKEEIRRLAGVERRSATRAFNIFQEKGLVVFSGYKRFFFPSGKEGVGGK